MSSIRQCHYCGRTFEDKGGFNEAPRVKNSPFGQVYVVCSIKCQYDFENFANEKSHSKIKNNDDDEPGLLAKIFLFFFLGFIALLFYAGLFT